VGAAHQAIGIDELLQAAANPELAFWSRIGVAFKNRDGSINLKLDFFPRDPATGLQVRWAPEEDN